GNRIGTDAAGLHARPNSFGVFVSGGASGNTIGGTTVAARNIISGNGDTGVVLSGAGTTGNVVAGDYIRTDASGAAALGNRNQGVVINGAASGNTVGGTAAGARNVISANGYRGVWLSGIVTMENLVAGDYIGTDASGLHALPNYFGVYIDGGAIYNTIGGGAAAAPTGPSGDTQDRGAVDGAAEASRDVHRAEH